MTKRTRLLPRIVRLIQDGGVCGIKRTKLTQTLRLNASLLNQCVQYLHTHGYISIDEVPASGWGQRGYTRYIFRPDALDRIDDLPDAPPAEQNDEIPGLPPRRSERQTYNHGAECRMCGKRLVPQQGGRPRQFCDAECRGQYFRETSTRTGRILHRADPATRRLVAYYLVAADLVARGGISFPPNGCQVDQLWFDGKKVTIYTARDRAHMYRGPIMGDIQATVFYDGRIEYEPPFADDVDEDT